MSEVETGFGITGKKREGTDAKIPYLELAAAAFLADQTAKCLVEKKIGKDTVIPTRFGIELRHAGNKGFALNTLDKHPGLVRAASAAAAGASVLALANCLSRKEPPLRKAGISLIAAGGLSNTLDRLIAHEVTDYISFTGRKRKVVYNLADFAIFAGGALCAFSAFSKEAEKERT